MSTAFWRVAVLGILVLATGARLVLLADYPPGLSPDQAANGEDALAILRGEWSVYSPRNNGRESLFFYVQAVTVGLLGVGVMPMFLASALVGLATVAATLAAGARLLGRGPALLAGLFLATNPWHVTLSRTGFRAVTTPLLLALALWASARMLQSSSAGSRWVSGALAGLFTGLLAYTYPAARATLLFLVLLGLAAIVSLLRFRDAQARARVLAGPLLASLLVAVLTLTPLAVFFAQHPGFLGSRVQHVSIFNPDLTGGRPLRALIRSSGKALAAFLWDGDGNPRHNVPLPGLRYVPGGQHHYQGGGAPFLSPLPALLAVVGIGVALRRARWLLLLAAVMLLPAVTTAEGIPHGLRTVGAIPAHVWLAGVGGSWLWTRFRRGGTPATRAVRRLAVGGLLVLTAAVDLWLYFGVARNTALAHYEYRADLTEVSNYLNEIAKRKTLNAKPPYLVLDEFSVMTVHFLTTPTGYPYQLVRPEESVALVLQPGEEMIFTQSTLADLSRYLETHPDAAVIADRANRFNETTMVVVGRRGP